MSLKAPLLSVKDLSQHFGGLKALDRLDLELAEGELLGVIGPDGSGKTTLLDVLSGLRPGTRGQALLAGRPLRGLRPDAARALGVSRVFREARLFSRLTALENVQTALAARTGGGPLGALLRGAAFRAAERADAEEAADLLERCGARALAGQLAPALDLAQRRRVALARALASRPRLLLLDEPTAGLRAAEREALLSLAAGIASRGVAVLLVEQRLASVAPVCARVVALEYGVKVAEGAPRELARDPRLFEPYAGRPS